MLFSRLSTSSLGGVLALALISISLSLSSCATNDGYGYASNQRYVPAVYIPRNLGETEQQFIYQVETTLTRAGYRLSNRRSAEYELDFRIEAGPINTDAYLTLLRDNRREVASAYARSSGLLNRQQVIRQAFEKCLIEFERQLPDLSHGSYDTDHLRDGYSDHSYGDHYRR